MCGFTGLICQSSIRDIDELLNRLNATLHHRGPDEDGLFTAVDKKVGLAHKRLSIIDLASGQQPMSDPEELFTLVFNGEIYNHGELRRELEKRGHRFRTHCDTEVLLHVYMEYRENCVQHLRGMFAFAVYEKSSGSVFLARDRLGIKPLYYGYHGDRVIFGSECKAILEHPGFSREIDYEALSDYLSLMYVPAPKSIFKHIRKLPAGHWLKINAQGDCTVRQYWDLEFQDESDYGSEKGLEAAQEELLQELEYAVKIRMESEVPLGAFLSGGVDSSAVVALMARQSSDPVITNTIGFDHQAYNEVEQARETAAFFKTDHHEQIVTASAIDTLEKLSWYYDEPFADSSMIPTYEVCKMARNQVTVALSGDGGDESFAGYRRHPFDFNENRIRQAIPSFIRKPVFSLLGSVYPKADWLPQPLRAKTLLKSLAEDHVGGYFRTMSHFLPEMKSQLMSGDLKSGLQGYNSLSVFEEHWNRCSSSHPLSKIQYLDIKTYMVDDILTKVDRASMAVSLEVRVPIIDHLFMEFAARLPWHWKLQGGEKKFILKKALAKILPPQILTRPKSGFSIPLKEWLRTELKSYASDILFSRSGIISSGMFDRTYVQKLFHQHSSGTKDNTFPLFALLSLALWHKTFIKVM